MAASDYAYPAPSSSFLRDQFKGKRVNELLTPSAILDQDVLKRNCERMLRATKALGVGFRPHVKTHKTEEITRLQLGLDGEGKVVVSTVREAEALGPLIKEGVVEDILYGVPIPSTAILRLSTLKVIHPNLTVSVLVDHPDQVPPLLGFLAPEKPWPLYIKLDMGTRRAGIAVSSPMLKTLIGCIRAIELETAGSVFLKGFYCHAGHSYNVKNTQAAFKLLSEEIETGITALCLAKSEFGLSTESTREWVLSVGATPTAMAAGAITMDATDSEMKQAFMGKVADLGRCGSKLEIHAGVYTMLDLQQLSTHVMSPPAELTVQDIAISILTEVVSVYPGRGADGGDEALVTVGTIGLGREPGKDWSGWGAVSNWGMPTWNTDGIVKESGWIVGRISQEHGILTETRKGEGEKLVVGQKVRIWPQHACIAGSGHGWYFVIDEKDVVQDVWVRWRGW